MVERHHLHLIYNVALPVGSKCRTMVRGAADNEETLDESAPTLVSGFAVVRKQINSRFAQAGGR